MKSLVIAEKPSVAKDLCKALGGKFKKQDDHFENDDYIVTSAVGHIVELCMPEDYDKRDAFWRLANLPIIPSTFKLKPIEKTESKYKAVKKLINRKDVDTIINACDAGREGELIFSYLYKLSKSKKPVKRLWMLSMTPSSIKEAFQNMKSGEEMKNLAEAAQSRSEADWLIGINCTRGVTKRLYGSRAGNVAGVGRVQTPTLGMVVEREREIERFQPRDYWQIVARLPNRQRHLPRNLSNRTSRNQMTNMIESIVFGPKTPPMPSSNRSRTVETASRTRRRSPGQSPRLYDLTTLQREANNRFGYSARRTLQLAQGAATKKHKMITYPRTDLKLSQRTIPEPARKDPSRV